MGADNSRDECFLESPSESKQPESTIDQLQFLTAHKRLGEYSLVQHLEKLDSSRFISASSDGTILIWYTKTGALLDVIEHYGPSTTPANLPVTGLKMLTSTTLLTGGTDKKIRIWDLPSSKEFDHRSHKTKLRHTLDKHNGGVKCFCAIPDPKAKDEGGLFVSAGTCNLVALWDALEGECLGEMCLRNADNIQSLIALAPYEDQVRVLLGTDNSQLIIVNFKEKDEYVLRTDHKESVQILLRLKKTSEAVCFLSASIDGLILGWRDDGQKRPRVIFCINDEVLQTKLIRVTSKFTSSDGKEEFENSWKEWSQRVRDVIALGYGNYAASVGTGFVVFNEDKGAIKCRKENGHDSYITHLAKLVLDERLVLVTGSVDSVVKLWNIGTPKSPGHPSWVGGKRKSTSFAVRRKVTFEPFSVLKAHSGSITAMVGLEDYCFASADEKANVILWKSHAVVAEQVRTKIRQNLSL